MADNAAKPSSKTPAYGQPFNPREVFAGIFLNVPEKIGSSQMLSSTAKLCYGHLVRRAGANDCCWPSIHDIAEHIGVAPRQATRAVDELVDAGLIRRIPRTDPSGRQTSNKYEFIWGPGLQVEGDKADTLPHDKLDVRSMTDAAPTGTTEMTPLEVSKRNHHQGRAQKRSSQALETLSHGELVGSKSFQDSTLDDDDDDDEHIEYASAKDELKAIAAKPGYPLRTADLDWIEAVLTANGLSWETFVEEARQHSWKHITNPAGFLKDLAKKFRLKTKPTDAPVTAAEAESRDYQCPKCFSRKRGVGALLVDGKEVPCACASPEWIVRQREHGIFGPEPTE